ncbi:MAG: hypothetical protein M1831_003886 [Alyxoria varia]|nr:MAG: hypothetical protein M1831_003886 [Alyxoria varia]
MSPKNQKLQVVALISGGKDSLYTIAHSIANGYDVVALANLYPAPASYSARFSKSLNVGEDLVTRIDPGDVEEVDVRRAGRVERAGVGGCDERADAEENRDVDDGGGRTEGKRDVDGEEDTNSYMYQTIGHALIPLYAGVLNLPLYRRPIIGGANNTSSSYHYYSPHQHPQDASSAPDGSTTDPTPEKAEADSQEEDETESLTPLLKHILRAHPQINAVCTGAILSTYQRTRVENVAGRLGLTCLGWLWMYPYLPSPSGVSSSSLLHDMAAAGLEARIIKMSTGGLPSTHLMSSITSPATITSLTREMSWFGPLEVGTLLGEGGEFETLCLDGPGFVKRIEVPQGGWGTVRGEGDVGWVRIERARLVEKAEDSEQSDGGNRGAVRVPIPGMWDPRFDMVVRSLSNHTDVEECRIREPNHNLHSNKDLCCTHQPPEYQLEFSLIRTPSTLSISNLTAPSSTTTTNSTSAQTTNILQTLTAQLQAHSIPRSSITSTLVLLRRMSDFAGVNTVYSTYFSGFPNPPARVTVAVGDLLPEGVDVSLSIVAHHQFARPDAKVSSTENEEVDDKTPGNQTAEAEAEAQVQQDRKALHVQSRSYWAPANIGPYSQAVSVPLLVNYIDDEETGGVVRDESSEKRMVHMAGQISLVPSTMDLLHEHCSDFAELPGEDATDGAVDWKGKTEVFIEQAALSLQHLWRVGRAMNVFYWAGGVAYLENPGGTDGCGSEGIAHRAHLAARTWNLAHTSSKSTHVENDHDNGDDEEDEQDADVDIAELSLYSHSRSFPRHHWPNTSSNTDDNLPDWKHIYRTPSSALEQKQKQAAPLILPQVAELPKAASIEYTAWGLAHAHSTTTSSSPVKICSNPTGTIDITYDLHSKHLILYAGVVRRGELEDVERILDFLLRLPVSKNEEGDGKEVKEAKQWLPEELLQARKRRGAWYEISNAELYLCSSSHNHRNYNRGGVEPDTLTDAEEILSAKDVHDTLLRPPSSNPSSSHYQDAQQQRRGPGSVVLHAAAIIPCARLWYASGIKTPASSEQARSNAENENEIGIKECTAALRCHLLPI